MKYIFNFVLLSVLLTGFSACSDDKENDGGKVYKIVNKHIRLYGHREAIISSVGDYMYLSYSHSQEATFIIYLSGYFMHGIVGKVHGLDPDVYNWDIPYSGLDVIVDGLAKKSTEGYTYIPEELSVDFFCTSIRLDPEGNETFSFKKMEYDYTNESKNDTISEGLLSFTFSNNASVE